MKLTKANGDVITGTPEEIAQYIAASGGAGFFPDAPKLPAGANTRYPAKHTRTGRPACLVEGCTRPSAYQGRRCAVHRWKEET